MPSGTATAARATPAGVLRERTRSAHERVEGRLDAPARLADRDAYRGWLELLLGFHAATDAVLEDRFADAGLPPSGRVQRLERDLAALGASAGGDRRGPAAATRGGSRAGRAACGALYVVEGSALGGAVLGRRARAALGVTPLGGAAFFSGAGSPAPRWRAVCSVLDERLAGDGGARRRGRRRARRVRRLRGVGVSLTPDFVTPGTPVDLDNCDREPIHLPGGIQPFGAMLVARRSDHMIVQVSRNAADLVAGVRPGATLTDVLGADVVEMLLERVQWAAPPALHPLRTGALDASAFVTGDRLVVELEPVDEGLDAEQLHVLVARTTGTLQAAGSTVGLVQAAAHAVRALTGFDRVWAYRFEADDHGVVVAEDRDERLESFLGLHYPASDIPVQARALFMRNGVRVIPDVQAAPVALEPELDPETGAWLDMSDGALRAVSPMHLRYLGNMGVRASMSIALTVRGRLWGLLSAHHYAGPKTVPAAMRSACELIGLMTSLQLDAKRDLEHARASLELERSVARLMEAVAIAPTIVQGLTADAPALLGACAADGAIVAVGGRVELVGATPGTADARRILRAVEHEGFDAVVAVDSLGERDPGSPRSPPPRPARSRCRSRASAGTGSCGCAASRSARSRGATATRHC